nr:MAG TPA: hypothetical protein [Caudoviricetes sp.]
MFRLKIVRFSYYIVYIKSNCSKLIYHRIIL